MVQLCLVRFFVFSLSLSNYTSRNPSTRNFFSPAALVDLHGVFRLETHLFILDCTWVSFKHTALDTVWWETWSNSICRTLDDAQASQESFTPFLGHHSWLPTHRFLPRTWCTLCWELEEFSFPDFHTNSQRDFRGFIEFNNPLHLVYDPEYNKFILWFYRNKWKPTSTADGHWHLIYLLFISLKCHFVYHIIVPWQIPNPNSPQEQSLIPGAQHRFVCWHENGTSKI